MINNLAGSSVVHDQMAMSEARKVEKQTSTRELLIINAGHGKKTRVQQDFCRPGDSGPLIFDVNRNVAGIMYGNY